MNNYLVLSSVIDGYYSVVSFSVEEGLNSNTYYDIKSLAFGSVRLLDGATNTVKYQLPLSGIKIYTNSLGEIDSWSVWEQGYQDGIYLQMYAYDTEVYVIPGFTGKYPAYFQVYSNGWGWHAYGYSSEWATNGSDASAIVSIADLPVLTFTDTSIDNIFTAVSGDISASNVYSDALTYGIVEGVVASDFTTKIGTYGTLKVRTSTGAYTFTPNDAKIEGLKTSATEIFTVTASNGIKTVSATYTVNLVGANDTPTGTITLTGIVVKGKILTVSNTLADREGKGVVTYQWQSSFDGVTWTNLSTGFSLTLGDAHVGKQIRVTGKYTDSQGTAESKTSSATQAVLNGFNAGTTANDTLMGTYAVDSLTGKTGDDLYYVNQIGDVVNEALNAGTDTVYSYLSSYTLAANVENGRIISSGNSNLAGNIMANLLYAGAGNNVLNGGAGTDTVSYQYGLVSGATLGVIVSLANTVAQNTGRSGSDTLISIENLTGSSLSDILTGNAGNNVLNGGAGADSMTGGQGNDIYVVDNAGDRVTELSSAGVDTIQSSITYSLLDTDGVGLNGGSVENLTLTGAAAINATGNGLSNTLTGNAGKNILTGGAGSDRFVFSTKMTATNFDTLTDFKVSGADKIVLDDDIFTALGITGTTAGAALTASKFQLGKTANDSGDRIIYDQVSGKLYYDADGNTSGGLAAIQIALIGTTTHATLASTDFLIVA